MLQRRHQIIWGTFEKARIKTKTKLLEAISRGKIRPRLTPEAEEDLIQAYSDFYIETAGKRRFPLFLIPSKRLRNLETDKEGSGDCASNRRNFY